MFEALTSSGITNTKGYSTPWTPEARSFVFTIKLIKHSQVVC